MLGNLIISACDLKKVYGSGILGRRKVVALEGVSFDVFEGEVFGVLGPNGAGKTTLFKVLLGLVRPTSGKATIKGIDISSRDARKSIGFVAEESYYYGHLKLKEHMKMMADLVEFGGTEKDMDDLLELVGLLPWKDAKISTLSRGMQQRFGIAQALLGDPDILILDEPATGLDPIGRREIRDLMVSLKEKGKTILYSSHQLSEVEMICDRVMILDKGRPLKISSLDLLIGGLGGFEIVASGVKIHDGDELSGLCSSVLRKGERVVLRLDDESLLFPCIDILKGMGARIVSISPARESLEDVFIRLVRGDEEG